MFSDGIERREAYTGGSQNYWSIVCVVDQGHLYSEGSRMASNLNKPYRAVKYVKLEVMWGLPFKRFQDVEIGDSWDVVTTCDGNSDGLIRIQSLSRSCF